MNFTIDSENNITAIESSAAIPYNAQQFSSEKELGKLAADWPAERLVDIWNGLPGVKPLKKFATRNAAAGRIWKAIQSLGADSGEHAPTRPRTKAKAGKKATPAKKAPKSAKKATGARDGSKTATILEMLKRHGGATAQELLKATGWQPHSLRGFISGTLGKKMGLTVESSKAEDGERTYSVKA